MTTDPFIFWVLNEVISMDNNGILTQTGNHFNTKKTMTVIRAVASWIFDLEESSRKV
ncbi:MAG: hypothetical protein WCF90_00825 [Methanomicrobiales archaeon]